MGCSAATGSSVKCLLSAILLAVFLAVGALPAQRAAAQEGAPPDAGLVVDAAGFPGLEAGWQQALAATLTVEQAYLPAPGPYTVTAFDRYSDAAGEWALAVVAPASVVEAGWEGLALDQLLDVLLLRTADGRVSGHVRGSPAFLALAQRTPTGLVDYSPLFAVKPAGQAEAVDYRFPWPAGQSWWLGGGWHSGWGSDALDFGPLTDEDPPTNSAVLAAASGTLRMACQNDDEQRLLWIEHANGERSGYLHMDRASVQAAVEEPGLVGQSIVQGTYLGLVYRGEAKTGGQCPANFPDCTFNTLCGYGNAPHLHFLAPSRTIMIDGYPIAALGDSQAGTLFTSSNMRGGPPSDTQPDMQPPSVQLRRPLTESTTLSPTSDQLRLDVVATDEAGADEARADEGESGVASVALQLGWQQPEGEWQTTEWVNADATAGDGDGNLYTVQMNVCSAALRVPHNRAVRISLRAADKAGNQTQIDEAGQFRLAFADSSGDCLLDLQDLFDLAAALADSRLLQPAHDVDGDGSVTAADLTALAALAFDESGAVAGILPSTPSDAPPAAPAPLLPGAARIHFTPLAASHAISTGRALAVSGTLALAPDWRAGNLAVFNLADPAAPVLHSRLALDRGVAAVSVAGGMAYVVGPQVDELAGELASESRLLIFDAGQQLTPTLATSTLLTSPLITPALVASMTLPGAAMQTAAADGLLYVAAGAAGLHIIDVRRPQTPTLLATLDTPGIAASVTVSGSLAFVADRRAGLLVVDTHDPTDPQLLATVAADSPAAEGTAAQGTAIGVTAWMTSVLLADGLAGVQIYDVSAPDAPRRLAGYATNSAANSLLLNGSILYVAAGWQGVLALDLSDLHNPRLAGSFDTPGYAHDLQLVGGLLYVADGDAGLQIVQVDTQQALAHILLIPLAGKEIAP